MKSRLGLLISALALSAASGVQAQPSTKAVPVTVDNFIRAETDMYFAQFAKRGGFGKFNHARDLPLGEDTGVRPNRDTLYSLAVFDLDAGPVTISLPEAGNRFMTMMIVDEDHYAPVVTYGKGTHTLDRQTIGTRYVFVLVRTLVDPDSLNNITAKKSPDGSVAIQFGGCDGKIPNCLPIMKGWNYMVRLYRPRAEILSGNWKFPEAQPVN